MIDRVRAFVGPHAEERAERVGHFFKALAGQEASRRWCVERGVGLTKAIAETGDAIGGFLAPDDFDAAVIAVRETVGAFRRGAQVRPVRSMNQVRPRRVGGLTAKFVADGQAIPESSFLLDAVEASMKKMAVLGRASTELFEDSAPDVGEHVASEIAYAFAALEDDCGFNGDGTSGFGGVVGLGARLAGLKSAVAAGSAHNTFLTLDVTDLGNLVAGVLAAAITNAAWYVNPVAYGQSIVRIAALGGGLVATQRPDGAIDANYMGFPVIFSGKLPDGSSSMVGKPMLYFGNLAMSSVIAERRKVTVATSTHRAMDADQVLVRGTQRVDLINHTVGDASTRGPVAMLVGTA